MKKITVQLIGITLIIISIIAIYYHNFAQLINSNRETFVSAFYDVFFDGIAIFGGIYILKLQEIGRKLVLIWFCSVLLIIASTKLPGYLSGESPFLAPSKMMMLVLIMCIYLFYALALIFLLDKKTIDLMSNNEYLMQKAGNFLSFCAPGLGRALVGNFFAGMGLFICYLWIMQILLSQQDLIAVLILGFISWKIFSFVDSVAVKQAFEIKQIEGVIIESEPENNRG